MFLIFNFYNNSTPKVKAVLDMLWYVAIILIAIGIVAIVAYFDIWVYYFAIYGAGMLFFLFKMLYKSRLEYHRRIQELAELK